MKTKISLALWCLFLLPGLALAQGTTISGSVVNEEGEALIGANVIIYGLLLGASTDVDGNYSFQVPSANTGETVEFSVKYIGYSPQVVTITLTEGLMTQDFVMSLDRLNLDEVVVTGVSEETPRKKLAFTVSEVGQDELTIAAGASPIANLQGKVAGVQVQAASGGPGDAISVRLRGSTSLTGGSAPLYIVDGVVLGANQVDIDALDIENMEIVKGAAASSFYGSRAHNGVINITTQRGSNIPLNQTRVVVRNEYGVNNLSKNLVTNRSHNYATDAAGNFLNLGGEKNECATCLANGYGPGAALARNTHGESFYDTPYQGELYDAFSTFFTPGDTYINYVGISQNSTKTNFLASFTNTAEQGAIKGLQGLNRKSFRVNLDHRVRQNLTFSASGFYAQSSNDALRSDLASDVAVNPFFGLMFTNPLVNLEARNEEGELIVQADPLAVEENPIYTIENADIAQERSRILGNFRVQFSPLSWMDIQSNFAYDRSDRDEKEFYDIGFATIDASSLNDGRVERRNATSEALNADATISARRTFGPFTTRGQFKAQVEDFQSFTEFVIGTDLTTKGISDLSNVETEGEKLIGNGASTVRSEGYYATFGADYMDRYIVDLFGRRDGSSLFGAEERWQTYYRASGAWRISEEDFWSVDNPITELKLRSSIGTAGGRPRFEAQYETLTLNNGQLSKSTLGNRFLKPELQTEIEVGMDIGIQNRIFLELVYAQTTVKDQLLEVPLASYFGFGSRWQNAGDLATNTIEATVSGALIDRSDLFMDFSLTFDRTRQEITAFHSNPYLGGPLGLFFIRDNERLGTMYGNLFITDTSQLPTGTDASYFDLNDDGYLVPVGQGNSYTSGTGADGMVGTDDDLWGTLVDVDGTSYRWGIPVKYYDEAEETAIVEIANAVPNFSLGLNTTMSYKGISVYMLWGAQVGGDVYNFTKQWSYRDGRASDQDQGGKAEGDKKSITYYEVLYDATARNSHFVEDATYIKLRELSVGYTFNRRQLQRVFGNSLHSIGISLIGRNLLTFADYTGFDPEVGSTAGFGDATLGRVDNFNYPSYRTYRAKLEIQF